jgi:hypothetical protein
LFWFLLIVGGAVYLAYQRIDLLTSTIATGVVVLAYTVYWVAGDGWWLWTLLLWLGLAVMVVPNLVDFRREKITRPMLDIYRKMLPPMSDTEREALEAGNVWWDGELFSGMPEWDRLMSYPAPELSEEEQAFLGLHHPESLFCDDHPQAIRRPRVLRLCQRHGDREVSGPQSYRIVNYRCAQLAGPGRIATALRH